MAGLLDIFGSGGSETMGLLGMSPEDIQRNRDDAQAQALYALAGRLFQGGNTGASIAQGLQAGQQAYKGAMQETLQDKLQAYQLQEMLKKRQQEQKMRELAPQIFTTTTTPEQVTYEGMPSQFPARDDEGNLMPSMAIKPAQTTRTIDPSKLQSLAMMSSDPLTSLASMAKLVPDLRKAGFIGGTQQEDNPFLVFTQDETVPKNIKTLAEQYAKSWSSGRLDPDVADKRVAELSSMTQRAQEKETAQANLKAQQDQMAELRRQGLAQSAEARALQGEIAKANLAITQANAEAKAEERNKPVTEAKESLSLINQAEKLLDKATASLTGTGVDVLAGAVGVSTEGAKAAAQLKAIQGALVSKMPKMSGPQSDKDVLLYREMAGQIGDSTLPVDTRKAALETIRQIQERYAKVPEGSSKPVETTPFKFAPAKEDRYQQWLKKQQGG